ncbi:MAG: DUF4399 domain-containing protein [Flavobacteriales bacterium]|nr:DUF4399 domain-containing protein [Flavobacteriales bacterium]
MKKQILVVALITSASYFMTSCGAPEAKQEEAVQTEETHDHDHADHDHDAMMEEAADTELLPVAEGAKVFFANLKDGQTVKSPVKIVFGVEGMTVKPAGELTEGTGHHHIIIDGAFLARGEAVPADSLNIHYGGGQTEAEIELAPGKHTLTMQFADGLHQSYGEQMSATITVNVE